MTVRCLNERPFFVKFRFHSTHTLLPIDTSRYFRGRYIETEERGNATVVGAISTNHEEVGDSEGARRVKRGSRRGAKLLFAMKRNNCNRSRCTPCQRVL